MTSQQKIVQSSTFPTPLRLFPIVQAVGRGQHGLPGWSAASKLLRILSAFYQNQQYLPFFLFLMCFLCRIVKTTLPSTSSLTGSHHLMPAVSLICSIFATHLIKQSSAFPYLGIRNLAEPKKKNINKTDMWQSLTYSSIKFQAMEASRINPQAASQRILEMQLFTTLPEKRSRPRGHEWICFCFVLFSVRRKSESGLIMIFSLTIFIICSHLK